MRQGGADPRCHVAQQRQTHAEISSANSTEGHVPVRTAERQVQTRVRNHHAHATKLSALIPERKQPEMEPRRRTDMNGRAIVHGLIFSG